MLSPKRLIIWRKLAALTSAFDTGARIRWPCELQAGSTAPAERRAVFPGGDYVLYWMQLYRRFERNHALDYALKCSQLWAKTVSRGPARLPGRIEGSSTSTTSTALDGRDPNSYTGILWCFGLFDRP